MSHVFTSDGARKDEEDDEANAETVGINENDQKHKKEHEIMTSISNNMVNRPWVFFLFLLFSLAI